MTSPQFTKLSHATPSIRKRHLESLYDKLFETKTISLESLLTQDFLSLLLQYFTFPEVPATLKALQITKLLSQNELGAQLLLQLNGMILFQQLKILLPTNRLKGLAEEICSQLARVRCEEVYFQKNDQDASRTERSISPANVSSIVAPSDVFLDDADSVVPDSDGTGSELGFATQQHLTAQTSTMHRTKEKAQNALMDAASNVAPTPHTTLPPVPVLSDQDEAFLFQINVKLRHINSEIVLDALQSLRDFLLQDVNIRVLLHRKMDILKSLLVALNSCSADVSEEEDKHTTQEPPSHVTSSTQLGLLVIECLDIFIDELYKLPGLEKELALETFHLIITHSLNNLKNLHCAPPIISYMRRLLPFVESHANDTSLAECWLTCLDSMTACLQYYHDKHHILFSDYIVIHIVDLFVKLLSKFPSQVLERSTPSPFKRALLLFVQQEHIYFTYPQLYKEIGDLFASIDQTVANNIKHTNRAVRSLQQKDILMKSASIFEDHEPHEITAEQITKALDDIVLILPGQVFDANALVVQRVLHELFLFAELSENDDKLSARCKQILSEILSHPSPIVRSTAYSFLSEDLEAFCSNFLTVDNLLFISIDTLQDTKSDSRIYENSSQLVTGILNRIDATDKQYHDMFRVIIPLLQCSIQEGKSYSSDVSGIINMLAEQFADGSITFQVYFRFLFHKQAWIREMAAKQISKMIKYSSIFEDPFSKFFDHDTFHEYENMFEPKSLTSFDTEGAKNVLRLMISPSLDVRIGTEIASQVVELIKVKRFRHLFATREFFHFLISSLDDERSEYVGFVEKCLLALRVLLHFEPRFRDDIRNDERLLTKLARNIFHTDLEVRLITCKMIAQLVFSPEMFSYDTEKFTYNWEECSDAIRKEYIPNSKYLPFAAVPEFLGKSFFVSRTATTYSISVKHTIHYPPKSSEHFIQRLRHLQTKDVSNVVRGLTPSGDAFSTVDDINFLKDCRNIDLYCIIKSRMHAICAHPSSLQEHLRYLNSIWFISPQKTNSLIHEADWRSAFGDVLENIPTSTDDDESLLLVSETMSRITSDYTFDKDDLEYVMSVFESNLLDQLVIVPSYWDDLPEQYVEDFSVNSLDRRSLRRSLLSFLCSLSKVAVSDHHRISSPPLDWMNRVIYCMTQYVDPRIHQHKHIFLQKKAAQIMSFLTANDVWYTGLHQQSDLSNIYSSYKQACKMLLVLLHSSSVIGFQLVNYLLILISNVGSIYYSHQTSWITDNGVLVCRLLIDDPVSVSRRAFAYHILSQSLVNCEDCEKVFSEDHILPQAIAEACSNMLNEKSDTTIREQSTALLCGLIRLLVQHASDISESLLRCLGCTDLDSSLSPLMQFLVQYRLHIKLPQILREERASKCFEEILVVILQYISTDAGREEIHSLLRDKYVIPFLIRFLNRPSIDSSEKPSLYLNNRLIAQLFRQKSCIKLLHIIFSYVIVDQSANFEDHFSTSSYIQMLLESLIKTMDESRDMGTRMASVRLLGLLLDGAHSHVTPTFDRILASKTITQDICTHFIAIYRELYQGNKYFSDDEQLVDSTMVISAALSLLLATRKEASEKALELGMVDTIAGVMENLVSAIQVEQHSRNVHSPKLHTYKFYLYSVLRLHRCFALDNLQVKRACIQKDVMGMIKSLWSFSVSTADFDLKYELLALVLNLISSCDAGLRAFVSDVNPSKKGTNKASLFDKILKFTLKARPVKQAPFRLTYLCFRILSCLAIGEDTRAIIIKYNVVEDYMRLLFEYLKSKDMKRVEVVIHFLVSLSTSKEGQNHIKKTRGLIDLVTACYDLNHVRVRSHALLLMRNLMFQKQNKAHFLQDSRSIEFLVDVLLNDDASVFGVELKATAASALWCLVHNNQKGKLMAKKIPSLQKRLEELLEKLSLEHTSLYNEEWEQSAILQQLHQRASSQEDPSASSKQKTEQYLLVVTLKNVKQLVTALASKKKKESVTHHTEIYENGK